MSASDEVVNAPGADAAVLETNDHGVVTLRLNRPKTMNAFGPDVKAFFETRVPVLVADPEVRCLLIIGSGKAFCAGGDIRTMRDRDPIAVKSRMERTYSWARPLMEGNTPVVTAINGIAAGAGLALALMGDIAIASTGATFRAGFTKIGVCPDLGVAHLLPRAVGAQRARNLLLTNRIIDSNEAAHIGLVSSVVSEERLLDEATLVANALANGPSMATALTRMLIRRSFETSWSSFLETETLAQVAAFNTADQLEGVDAFLSKRQPDFRP